MMKKKALKRKRNEEVEEEKETSQTQKSNEPSAKKIKWINRQRVLVFATRGINQRHRHLMEDIKMLMPHHRAENKMEHTKNLQVINEMCEMKNCNKSILFESRKKRHLYMWLANVPNGPSAKFLVENIFTMKELKMSGNCMKGSRPLLIFETSFSENAHYSILKELLTQIFGVPHYHPKSQPFFDHMYLFYIIDNRIWFKNFQFFNNELIEIGPQFVLNPIKIFADSFGGKTLWENPHYVSPAKYERTMMKKVTRCNKYKNKIEQKMAQMANKPEITYALNPIDEIFKGDITQKVTEIEEEHAES